VKVGPEAGSLTLKPRAFSGNADVLAGEPAADCVNGNSICGKSVCGKGANVIVLRNLGPVFRQHLSAEGVYLAEGDRLERTAALQAEGKAPDTREKVEQAKRLFHPLTFASSLWI
jgi:hypothetical protein